MSQYADTYLAVCRQERARERERAREIAREKRRTGVWRERREQGEERRGESKEKRCACSFRPTFLPVTLVKCLMYNPPQSTPALVASGLKQ